MDYLQDENQTAHISTTARQIGGHGGVAEERAVEGGGAGEIIGTAMAEIWGSHPMRGIPRLLMAQNMPCKLTLALRMILAALWILLRSSRA